MLRQIYLFLALLPCVFSHALYNGNPSFPLMPEEGLFIPAESWFGAKFGYEWDYTFNHPLKVKDPGDGIRRHVQTFQSMGNAAVVTLILRDRVEAYGTFGVMQAEIDQNPKSGTHLKYSTNQDFCWEVGGRAILIYWGKAQLGVDAKYFEFSPSMQSVKANGSSVNAKKIGMLDKEWQVGVSASYRLSWFIPYIGIKHCNVDLHFSELDALSFIFPSKHESMSARHEIGVFLGFGLCPKRGFNVNAEVRLLDETSVTLSGDIRF